MSDRAKSKPPAKREASTTRKAAVGSRQFKRRSAVASRRSTRESQRRTRIRTRRSFGLRARLALVPRAAWTCAAVAVLSAVAWSLITPPFQAPDEPSHFAYVKQWAETSTLPTSSTGAFSAEEEYALQALRTDDIRHSASTKAIFSRREQQELDSRLSSFNSSPRTGSAAAGVATSQPPLYYMLEAIPYTIGGGGTLLDRLQLMRWLSSLMAGITALFAFLFLREALPSERLGWTIGGMCVALCPLFGFMSGSVNPDSMLFAVSAAIFYFLARAFRRGLTPRLGIAIGATVGIGFLTKLNFIGLAPGILLGLAIIGLRRREGERREAKAAALAAAVAVAPVCIFVLINALTGRAALGFVANALDAGHGSLLGELNYIWQSYLPRIPGTHNDFRGLQTTLQIWFDGYVGRLGWLDTFFPSWVYSVALAVGAAVLALCARTLIVQRAALREHAPEIATYGVISLGLLLIVGASGFNSFPGQPAAYGQARYLLPLLPLLGAVLALAARGAGRRWMPAVGALLVCLFLAHDVFSQLQVVARYYG